MDDNGNSSFTQHVILNGPPQTKLVMIMEDLSHWKNAPPGYPISKEQMILCLKNVAILHAKFWGLKDADTLNIGIAKTEQDGRPAAHKMLSRLFLKKLSEGLGFGNHITNKKFGGMKTNESHEYITQGIISSFDNYIPFRK